MHCLLAFLFLSTFAPGLVQSAPAQSPPSAGAAQMMKKLGFLEGNWEGSGYIEFVPGPRKTFEETERVQNKLGGLLLLIEGTGRSKTPDGKQAITHNALGIVSYDEHAGVFRWLAYNRAGPSLQSIETVAKVGQDSLEWGYRDPRAGTFRFTIRVDRAGRWVEIGDVSRNGMAWRKFFQMSLQRVP